METPKKAFAITGGIGSGKSTVLACLKKNGARVIHADSVAKKVLYSKRNYKRVGSLLGHPVFKDSGELDVERIADTLFSDETKQSAMREIVNELVWPEIKRRIERTNGASVYVESATIHEYGWKDRFSLVICVWCEEEKAIERILNDEKRHGTPTRAQVEKRMRAQLPIPVKRSRSDISIYTGDMRLEDMRERIMVASSMWDSHAFDRYKVK